MSQLNFDARQVAPQQTFDPVPAGWYNFMIVESEMKPTSNGQGAYLQLTLKIVDGAHAGRQVFDRLNLQNQNPVASEIAYRRLSAYCHATGVIQVQDSQQLHGIPFKGRVSVRTDSSGQYDPSNEVKAVKHINEDTGASAAPATWAPPAQAAQPPAGPPPGWAPPAQASATWAPPQVAAGVAPAPATWAPPQAAPAPASVAAPTPAAPAPAPAAAPPWQPSAGAQLGAPPWAQAPTAAPSNVPPWVKQ